MALDMLYGPSDVTVDATAVATLSGSFATWLQGVGLLAVLDPAGGSFGLYAVQVDGAAESRSTFNGSGSGLVLDLRSVRGLAVKNADSLYNFNWLVGQPESTPFLTLATTIAGGHDIDVIAGDGRYLQFSSGTPMQVLSSLDGATFTAEYTFAAPAGYTLLSISRGRSPTEVCIAYTNGSIGQLRFYDVVAKTQVGATRYIGEPFDGAWYVPKWDIFVELKSKQIKILADSVYPTNQSDPTASPSVAAGLVSTLTVRLLGAQDEPCVGELINWSISSGPGSLTSPQSATDGDGYATTGLVIPVGSVGTVSVDATLNY